MPRCPHCGESHGPEIHFCSRTGQPLDLGPRLIGQTFLEGYEVVNFLGEGPVGAVLEVELEEDGERVRYAAKMLHPRFAKDDVAVERFLREAELAGKTGSPNVAAVFATGRDNGGAPLVVREYMEGQSLDRFIEDREQLSISSAIRICRQILEGLEAAHEAGVGNFDLSPGDVFLVDTGQDQLEAKLVDFGEAHLKHALGDEATVRSSPYYAPEMNREDADERVDLWAAACILYEMLTGRLPFGESPDWSEGKPKPARPVRQLREEVDRLLEAVLLKALSPDASRRYLNAGAFEAALARAMGDRPSLTPTLMPQGTPPRPSIPAPGTPLSEELAASWVPAAPVESPPAVAGKTGEAKDKKRDEKPPEKPVDKSEKKAATKVAKPAAPPPGIDETNEKPASKEPPVASKPEKKEPVEKKPAEEMPKAAEKKPEKSQAPAEKEPRKEVAAAAPAVEATSDEKKPAPKPKQEKKPSQAPKGVATKAKKKGKKKSTGAKQKAAVAPEKKPAAKKPPPAPAKVSPARAVDDGDEIPQKKPVWLYLGVVGVIIVGGLVFMYSRSGDSPSTSHARGNVAQNQPSNDDSDEGNYGPDVIPNANTAEGNGSDAAVEAIEETDTPEPEETEPEETEPEETEPEETAPEEVEVARPATPEPEETEEAQPPEPAAEMVRLILRATPSSATLTVDGEAVLGNPHRGRVERSGRYHLIRASADGFRPVTKRVRFDRDVNLALTLTKRGGGPTRPGAARPPRRPPRPAKRMSRPPREEGVLRRDNPFD